MARIAVHWLRVVLGGLPQVLEAFETFKAIRAEQELLGFWLFGVSFRSRHAAAGWSLTPGTLFLTSCSLCFLVVSGTWLGRLGLPIFS